MYKQKSSFKKCENEKRNEGENQQLVADALKTFPVGNFPFQEFPFQFMRKFYVQHICMHRKFYEGRKMRGKFSSHFTFLNFTKLHFIFLIEKANSIDISEIFKRKKGPHNKNRNYNRKIDNDRLIKEK